MAISQPCDNPLQAMPATSVQTIDDLAVEYSGVYKLVEEMETKLAELKRIKAEKAKDLIDVLVLNEKNKWSIPGVGQFLVKSKNHLSVTDQDKATAFIKDKAPELLKVHTTFIKSWFNEYKQQFEESHGISTTEFWEDLYGIKPYQAPELSFKRG